MHVVGRAKGIIGRLWTWGDTEQKKKEDANIERNREGKDKQSEGTIYDRRRGRETWYNKEDVAAQGKYP